MDPAIPTVEIANHADTLRVRRPYREVNATGIADRAHMRAELIVNLPMLSFGEKMQIDLAHDRAVLIGIACQVMRSVPGGDSEMVRKIPCCVPDSRAKETVLLDFLRCNRFFRMLVRHYLNLARIGPKGANLQIVPNSMRTQHSEGVGMGPSDKEVHFIRWQSSDLERFHGCSLKR